MKDENILVVEDGAAGGWTLYLVDLDRLRRYRGRLCWRRRVKNLVQLERTLGRRARRTERLFFLYRYLGAGGTQARVERRALVSRILRLRARKDREYRRRALRRGGELAEGAAAAQVGRSPVSCCVICFNEEKNVRRCLESVKWCDEIVVVDSFSTDRTVAICREYTERVLQRPWPGYVEQKRFALSQTEHEWVLNVDADEEVSPELQREIGAVLAADGFGADGYYLPRLVYYLGRWWWRGWYPGYRLRLFRKTRVRWGGVDPHERVILRGRAGYLRSPLYHYTYENIGAHVRTLNGLTDVAARELHARGRRAGLWDLLARPLWRFLRMYVARGCYREGFPGLFVALTSAFYVFLKYAKLWERSASRRDG